jgi:hypothetical protein
VQRNPKVLVAKSNGERLAILSQSAVNFGQSSRCVVPVAHPQFGRERWDSDSAMAIDFNRFPFGAKSRERQHRRRLIVR